MVWSYNRTDYAKKIKDAKASIPQATNKTPGAIPGVGYGQVMAASQANTPVKPAIPQTTPSPVSPVSPGNPAMSSGMAGAYAAASGAKTTGAVPQGVPIPGSHESHQAYINKSTPGGLSAYQAGQQVRYDQAYASGNQDEINKLNADVQRVGYSLMIPQAAQPSPEAKVATPDAGQGTIPSFALNPNQINQEASYQINKERSDLATAADKMMAQLKSNSAYSNKNLQDNRTLRNFDFKNRNDPFSGNTGYVASTMLRGDAIDDTYRAANLDAELNAVQADLYNFDKLAPDKQRALINEMTRIERDYGLQVSDRTGNLNGQRTLAGTASDRAGDQQQWENRFNYGQATGTFQNGQQTLDAKQFEFQKVQQEWENNFKTGQFDWQKAQTTWENAFQGRKFEQDMKEAASSRGLQWASLDQRQKEFVADQTFREKQFTLEQDKFEASKNTGSQLSDKDSTDNYNTIFDDLQSEEVTKDTARQLLQANKSHLSDSDYNKLNTWINDNF